MVIKIRQKIHQKRIRQKFFCQNTRQLKIHTKSTIGSSRNLKEPQSSMRTILAGQSGILEAPLVRQANGELKKGIEYSHSIA